MGKFKFTSLIMRHQNEESGKGDIFMLHKVKVDHQTSLRSTAFNMDISEAVEQHFGQMQFDLQFSFKGLPAQYFFSSWQSRRTLLTSMYLGLLCLQGTAPMFLSNCELC